MARHLKPLMSLRGVAAVMILLHHSLDFVTRNLGNSLALYTQVFKTSYLWVDFFFILSGFILTHLYWPVFLNNVDSHSYRSFLFSRFSRLYPLHIFMLTLFLCVELLKLFIPISNVEPFTGSKSFAGLFTNLFLLQAIDFNAPPLFEGTTYWNEPAWAISVQWLTYLVLPFLITFLYKKKRIFDLAIYFTTWYLLFIVVKSTDGSLNLLGLPSLTRCILECVMGIVICKTYQKYILTNHRNLSINLCLFISILWVFLGMHYHWNDLLVIPAFCFLILTAALKNESDDNYIAVALNSRFMIYLGKISFAIYMVHWFIQELYYKIWKLIFKVNFDLGSNLNSYESIIILITYVLIVLLSAILAYIYIEKPMQNFLKNSDFAKINIYNYPK